MRKQKDFFISDLHFWHYLVIKYAQRPFSPTVVGNKMTLSYSGKLKTFYFEEVIPNNLSEKEKIGFIEKNTLLWMHEILIYNWNSVVGKDDRIIYGGDFSYSNKENIKSILDRLNGYKILIKGNHDRSENAMKDCGFDEVHDNWEMNIGEDKVIFSHYPYVPPELVPMADRRPNPFIIKKQKGINPEIPQNLEYKDYVSFLEKFNKVPIHSLNDDFEDYFKELKRMSSKFLGTRLINEGEILLHGHTHSYEKRFLNMINLSCEAWDYVPASTEDIKVLIEEWKKERDSLKELSKDELSYLDKTYSRFKNEVDKKKIKDILDLEELKNDLEL